LLQWKNQEMTVKHIIWQSVAKEIAKNFHMSCNDRLAGRHLGRRSGEASHHCDTRLGILLLGF
jgi:hypothetical protein